MIPSVNRRLIVTVLIAAAAAAAFWAIRRQAHQDAAEPVAIQDGKTIDFSGGAPVVRDTAADKAAMDAAVKQMDAAAGSVTFHPDPEPKK
jgi:hypothetical protein